MPEGQFPNCDSKKDEPVSTEDNLQEPYSTDITETCPQDSGNCVVQGIRSWAKGFQEYASKVDL